MMCERCEPCRIARYKLKQAESSKTHYFYTEKVDSDQQFEIKSNNGSVKKESNKSLTSAKPRAGSLDSNRKKSSPNSTRKTASDDSPKKNVNRNRPSSAENKKTTSAKKKSLRTLSETKISKKSNTDKSKNKNGASSKPENVEELRKDLDTIKQQLFTLTENRQEAVEVTNELQLRYKNLSIINENQSKEIEYLKQQNCQLLCQIKQLSANINSSNTDEISEAKKSLDQYNSKLTELYNEFMDAAAVMGKSKEQVCQCIKQKEEEYKKLENTKKQLHKEVSCKDEKLSKILQSYNKLKECQKKFVIENRQLANAVEKLQSNLNRSLEDADKFRKDAACLRFQQEQLQQQNDCYLQQLNEKSRTIAELNGKIQQMAEEQETASKNEADYENLNLQYQQLLFKHKTLLAKFKVNEENDKTRFKEFESIKKNEKCLCEEICRMKRYADDLCKMVDEGKMNIARLKTLNQEKDTIIQCQLKEIDFKNKEIECLTRHVERLKVELTRLQDSFHKEDSCDDRQKKNVVFSSNHCCISLTDELQDLITALYEEIDKATVKDEEIEKQQKNICCLQCALTAKEKELHCVKNELKVTQDQLKKTVQEKHTLVKSLNRLEQLCSTEEDFECYAEEDESCSCYV